MSKVALVVGHRQGAQGAWGSAGISEFTFNTKLAIDIKKRFGDEVKIFFRDDLPGGYGEKMKRLHKKIDSWGADYSISLHFNAVSNVSVAGHEVLYCSKSGKELASLLNNNFEKFLKTKNRGIKKRSKGERGGGFLCRGKSVCVIAEPFFAPHQHLYVDGTSGYDNLISAYVKTIKGIL